MRIAIVNDMPLAVEALRRALAFEPKPSSGVGGGGR
jgi:two-component system, chemotaxis family, response regulator WspF